MLSTFDLTLLGSLVSAGGLAFLGQAKWPHHGWRGFHERQSANRESNSESRERLKRSTTIAGARWLTVGALTLFVAHTHGAEEGYLFGPWGDVLFHVIFVSTSWRTTAIRMKQKAERQTGETNDSPISTLSLPGTSPSRISD
jgi:hypothetical protein